MRRGGTTVSALALALWATPALAVDAPPPDATVYQLGARVGVAGIEDAAYLVVNPWAGGQWGDFAMAVQAPLRVRFADATLRERDWDEPADFGRLLRFARYGEAARMGVLADLTLGHGTLVRRYRNGVDDDHHRLGLHVDWQGESLRIDAFADHVLGPPVFAVRAAMAFAPRWTAALTFAADTAAPHSLDGTADGTGRLNGERGAFTGLGLEVDRDLVEPSEDGVLQAYLAAQLLDRTRVGAHLGLAGAARLGADDRWRIEGRLEAIGLAEGYLWSPFDAGYLIDRHRRLLAAADDLPATVGGRAGLTVAWAEAVVVGAEYADTLEAGRADLTVSLQVPVEKVRVGAFWHQRGGPERASVIDPSLALAAAAATMQLSPGWWVDVAVARVWRVSTLEAGAPDPTRPVEPRAYTPGTEFFVTLEAAFEP